MYTAYTVNTIHEAWPPVIIVGSEALDHNLPLRGSVDHTADGPLLPAGGPGLEGGGQGGAALGGQGRLLVVGGGGGVLALGLLARSLCGPAGPINQSAFTIRLSCFSKELTLNSSL